jgi:LacI family transcriptional regulator
MPQWKNWSTGPLSISPSADRFSGYKAALKDLGLPVKEQYILPGDFHLGSGREATHELLALKDPPSALFACNDLNAIGAISAAQEVVCRVPECLAVVGFDDIDLASYIIPPLTTIAKPKKEICDLVIKLLFARINDNSYPANRCTLPGALIIRASCGGG